MVTVNATAHKAILQWHTPFSLIPITQYFIQFRRVEDATSMTEPSPTVTSDPMTVILNNLCPFSNYEVTVVAMNRAGNSSVVTVFFTTLSDGQSVT